MRNWPWRTVVLLVAGGFILNVLFAPDPTAQDLSSRSTHELIEMLASPREVVRQAATGQLIARAKTVVPDLTAAARRTPPPSQFAEVLGVLEELMLTSDQQVAESAETALELLLVGENGSVADLADRALSRNAVLRHTRALSQITQLGGTVFVVAGNEAISEGLLFDPVATFAATRPRPTTRVVLLDDEWQGGDAGLRHVARLFPREPLSLHISQGAPISDAALKHLRTHREHTQVRRPQQGCLGVRYNEEALEPMVNGVTPNSPAERAGMRAGDLIVAVNGQPVERFSHLFGYARERKPGEFIELTLRRRNQVVRLKFALGTDFGTGVCACVK
jgi:hypothetical protein